LSSVLTERHLGRALLARQLLLERSPLSLTKALERIGGIQAQYTPSTYIGLWTRLEGFESEQLERALERRTVVQGSLMRVTIHLVSARDWWRFAVGVRDARRRYLLRTQKRTEREFEAAARKIRKEIAGGTLTQAEMRGLLGEPGGQLSAATWIDLVRVPPSGTWARRRADIHASAEDWLGTSGEGIAFGDAVDHLVRARLRGFGPATRAEIADWAGIPPAAVAESLERLDLRRFSGEDGKELVDLPRAPLPDPDTPAPPRLLPVWDAVTLKSMSRAGILPQEYRPRFMNVTYAQSMNAFLVDGRVAGVWKPRDGRVEFDPFEKVDRGAMRELRAEAERLVGALPQLTSPARAG
jgi:winged helix DNA-binding protein